MSATDLDDDPSASEVEPEGHLVFWSFREDFGPFLRDHREGLRLSLREAGERAGVSHTVLARLETGQKAKRPPIEFLRRLADAYGCEQDEMLARGGFLIFGPDTLGVRDLSADQFEAVVLAPEVRPLSLQPGDLARYAPIAKLEMLHVMKRLAAMDDPKGFLDRVFAEARKKAQREAVTPKPKGSG